MASIRQRIDDLEQKAGFTASPLELSDAELTARLGLAPCASDAEIDALLAKHGFKRFEPSPFPAAFERLLSELPRASGVDQGGRS